MGLPRNVGGWRNSGVVGPQERGQRTNRRWWGCLIGGRGGWRPQSQGRRMEELVVGRQWRAWDGGHGIEEWPWGCLVGGRERRHLSQGLRVDERRWGCWVVRREAGPRARGRREHRRWPCPVECVPQLIQILCTARTVGILSSFFDQEITDFCTDILQCPATSKGTRL